MWSSGLTKTNISFWYTWNNWSYENIWTLLLDDIPLKLESVLSQCFSCLVCCFAEGIVPIYLMRAAIWARNGLLLFQHQAMIFWKIPDYQSYFHIYTLSQIAVEFISVWIHADYGWCEACTTISFNIVEERFMTHCSLKITDIVKQNYTAITLPE